MKQKRPLLATRLLLSLLAVLTASTAGAQTPATIGGITYDADGGYYVIDEPDDLRDLATYVTGTGNYRNNTPETTAHDCSGLKFKMAQDITFTATTTWDDATSTENNFVTIGGNDGSTNRSFCGDFDGAGHTISGIRIYRSTTADQLQGIFGQTGSGATIHNLRLADARITGYDRTGGIVGKNSGTVTDCHVANNVCIHAAESNVWWHGGIAGENYGTVANCTSAADLTIYLTIGYTHQCYGAIAGRNNEGGTLRDNLAIGAGVPSAKDNTHGAIVGYNSINGTLERNYYTACNVAGAFNTAGVGCNFADVTTNDGAVSVHTITLDEGITITSPEAPTVTYGGTGYYKSGVTITLSNTAAAPAGYQYAGYTANAGTLSGSTLTMPDKDVTISAVLVVIPWTGSGDTKDDPFIIQYPSQLDLLAHRVNGTHGETLQSDGYSGKYFRLANDIAYTYTTAWDDASSTENNYEAIGCDNFTNDRYFLGNFDGAGYTISGIRIHRSGSDEYTDRYQGIFGRTGSGANIHDLRLADARITGYEYTGGIVGSNDYGTVTDCHVANDVCIHAAQNDADDHGGIAGYNYSGTVANCTSAATLTVPSNAGLYQNYGAIAGNNYGGTLRDNLAIGATVPAAHSNFHGAIIGYNSINGTLQCNYYTACKVAGVENATGKGCKNADITSNDGAVSVHTITLGEGITITSPAAPTVTYGGTGYYKSGVTITLVNTVPAPAGYQYDGYTASAGNLSGSTFTMPDEDVTISLGDLTVIPWTGSGDTKDDPFIIQYPSQLDLLAHRVNGTHGETLQEDGYDGKYFRLANDINYTYTTAWDDASSTENNYEAIGSINRSFSGDFDGAGHTISGIRIYRSTGNADKYQGIFGQTKGANIHGLRLADARITGYDQTGGIVGYNYNGSTVTDCHVASNVCIHAAQSNVYDHGGIAGQNQGTVGNCTSAATLTIPTSDTSCRYYGAIAGYNWGGILRDNLAIGATVPAADNYHGAIVGYNSINGTLQRNYYTACKVANVENATNVGCGYIDDGNGNYTPADVTADDGAVSVHTITLGEGITITSPAAPTVTYGGTGYYKSGVTITLNIRPGYMVDNASTNVTITAGAFTMPASDVTVTCAVIDWATVNAGTAADPYMIYNKYQLDLLAHRVNSGTGDDYAASGYSGKYFQLGADIAYTYTTAWDDASSTENNYEAIGYFDGTNDRKFCGDFDGAGHTISGIRIHRSGSDYTDRYQGVFGQTYGANIHGLRLADARITGYYCIGGIVGYNFNGSTVTDCHVANDVCIHAAKNNASCHGGIVGENYYNGSTVESCTSAATLTIPTGATNCSYYGAIAGNNNSGTLRDNLAIGATVPAATDYTHGAIAGYNHDGTLQRNYYTACKVAGVENATGKGCRSADITSNDGAVPALRDDADNTNALALMAKLPTTFGVNPATYPVVLNGRTLTKDGNWNTLCLPFGVDDFSGTPLEGATVKELDAANSNLAADGTLTLKFTDASSIVAGKPYIVKWESASGTVADPVFNGVTISKTAPVAVEFANISGLADCQFVGQYSQFSIVESGATGSDQGNLNEIILMGSGSTLGYSASAPRTLRSFRAHFLVPTTVAGSRAARAFVLDFGDGDNATGIISINADNSAAGADGWYDLNGRRLNGQPTQKGVYIVNGKIIVVK